MDRSAPTVCEPMPFPADTWGCVSVACDTPPPTSVLPAEPPEASCCYDSGDCVQGYLCYDAQCSAGQPGRCLPWGERDRCWHDADCAYYGEFCDGAIIHDCPCDLAVDVVATPGICRPL